MAKKKTVANTLVENQKKANLASEAAKAPELNVSTTIEPPKPVDIVKETEKAETAPVVTETETTKVETPAAPATPEVKEEVKTEVTEAPAAETVTYSPEEQAQLDAIGNAYQERERSLTDILEENKRVYDEQMALADQEVKAAQQKAVWAGATEAVSALANLVGTTGGAANQQYQFKTDNWMKEAERQRELRQSKKSQLRQQLRESEKDLANVRGAGQLAMANQMNTIQRQRVAQQRADAQIAYQNARTEIAYDKAELDKLLAYDKRKLTAAQVAQIEARIKEVRSRIDLNEAKAAEANAKATGAATGKTGTTTQPPQPKTSNPTSTSIFDSIPDNK